jgi:RHS repeat-associated protein
VRTSFTYDNADRTIQLASVAPNGSMLTSFTYRYDNTANRTGVTEVDSSVTTWSYDASYQLIGEQRTNVAALDWVDFTLAQWGAFTLAQWATFVLDASSGTYNTTYTYDPVGNRLFKSANSALTTYSYDAANQVKTAVASTGVTTYTFDLAGNQQVEQSPTGITTNTWVSYNGDGSRVQKQDSTGTSRFVWDGQAYLAETDGSNATQVEYTNEPIAYGGLISQYRRSGVLWLPSYYAFDALGSAVRLTNAQASVTSIYLYKAFGEVLEAAGGTINPFLWLGQTGYYFDVDTTTSYVRARTYDPIVARWLSQDPLGFDADDVNFYRYVSNRALTASDASGLQVPLRFCSPRCLPKSTFPRLHIPITEPPIVPPPPPTLPVPPVTPVGPISGPRGPKPMPIPNPVSDPPGQGMRPPGDCGEKQYELLTNTVQRYCKAGTLTSCQSGPFPWNCQSYDDMAKRFDKCLEARRHRENACFRGGDLNHLDQIRSIQLARDWCNYYYQRCAPAPVIELCQPGTESA